jgi:hypothetical protein
VPWLAQQALLVVEAFKPNSLQSLSQAQSNLHRKQVTLLFSELNLAGNMLPPGCRYPLGSMIAIYVDDATAMHDTAEGFHQPSCARR